MAPTEILAEQHYLNAKRILAPLGYSIGVVRRGIKKAEKKKLFEELAAGEIQVVIGTHALFEEKHGFQETRPGRHRRTASLRRRPATATHGERRPTRTRWS